MKLDRLLGITIELMTKKRVTAPELASKFEVSARTIYRDLELLNQAGIPVVSFSGTDGGYELMEGFFLSKQHFSLDDFSMIYNFLRGLECATGDQQFTSIKHKLSTIQPALLNEKMQEKIIFNMGATNKEQELIPSLLRAIDQSKRLAFRYRNASGHFSEREVEPYNLLWERGIWYLEGYCLSKKEQRYFRVSRIMDLQVLEATFQKRMIFNTIKHWENRGIHVRLRFQSNAQPRVLEQFPEECTFHGDYIDVQTVFYSKSYAISVILSYGSNVEIISPDELKRELVSELKKIQAIYAEIERSQ